MNWRLMYIFTLKYGIRLGEGSNEAPLVLDIHPLLIDVLEYVFIVVDTNILFIVDINT